jgi:hypothetical protein
MPLDPSGCPPGPGSPSLAAFRAPCVAASFGKLSKNEQRKRLLKRLKDPKKQWKFSAADIAERAFWDD